MDGITCDMCGKSLLVDEGVRYIARVEIFAAYDVLELTSDDLAKRDIRKEIAETIDSMKDRDSRDLAEEVHAVRRFDLCPSCRRKLLEMLPPNRG